MDFRKLWSMLRNFLADSRWEMEVSTSQMAERFSDMLRHRWWYAKDSLSELDQNFQTFSEHRRSASRVYSNRRIPFSMMFTLWAQKHSLLSLFLRISWSPKLLSETSRFSTSMMRIISRLLFRVSSIRRKISTLWAAKTISQHMLDTLRQVWWSKRNLSQKSMILSLDSSEIMSSSQDFQERPIPSSIWCTLYRKYLLITSERIYKILWRRALDHKFSNYEKLSDFGEFFYCIRKTKVMWNTGNMVCELGFIWLDTLVLHQTLARPRVGY